MRLDYQQRLNLTGLVGSQKGTVAEMRTYWALMDKLELSAEEKKEINYRVVRNGEFEVPTWDAHEVREMDVDLSLDDVATLKRLIEGWPSFRAVDRAWLEPLCGKLNGNG